MPGVQGIVVARGTLRSCASERAAIIVGRFVVQFRHVAPARAESALAMLELDVFFVVAAGFRHLVLLEFVFVCWMRKLAQYLAERVGGGGGTGGG